MKFEDLLMQATEEKQKIAGLEEEVCCVIHFLYKINTLLTFSTFPKPLLDQFSQYKLAFIQVDKMEGVLDRELKVNKILQCALQGPIQSCPCLSSVLPVQVYISLLSSCSRLFLYMI